MNKLIRISIISIMMIFFLTLNVCAFENEIYKMNIPSEYASMSYAGMDVFTKGEEYGVVIYSFEAVGLKKNLSTMPKSEVNELLGKVISKDAKIIEQSKEKLGKAKSIKARVLHEESYMDVYIVVSDKHILLISFVAPNQSELDSEEYLEIKKSFKMKERTTNANLVKFGIGAVAVVGAVFKFKNQLF